MKKRIPINIHTHLELQLPGEAIVNCSMQQYYPKSRGWYSIGIHPWDVTDNDITGIVTRGCFEVAVQNPQVVAVGEAGLDKMASAPMSLQMEVFEFQAQFAKSYNKPLIIHLVKAMDELLKVKRKVRPTNPWIIHGFRGKPEMAQECLRHYIYLSFGEHYNEEAMRLVPADKFFMETDNSVVPIDELYKRAAAVRGVTPKMLKYTVQRNVSRIFFNEEQL